MFACPNHPSELETRRCGRCARSYCKNCLVLLRGTYFCADCKSEQVRDVQSGTDRMQLEYASIGRRFGALFLDGMLQGCVTWVLILPFVFAFGGFTALMQPQGKERSPEFMVGFFAIYAVLIAASLVIPVVYEGVMLSRDGQTLGKKAMGLKVVTAEGGDISQGQAWGRAGIRLAVSFACAFVDYIPAFFNDEKLCLHDMVVKTRVVRL